MVKINKYSITAKPNVSGHRRIIKFFSKKSQAEKELKKWLSKPKFRIVNGKKIYLTSYRTAQSGTGINNPRIKKIRGYN